MNNSELIEIELSAQLIVFLFHENVLQLSNILNI